jgi:hypothetical protein
MNRVTGREIVGRRKLAMKVALLLHPARGPQMQIFLFSSTS